MPYEQHYEYGNEHVGLKDKDKYGKINEEKEDIEHEALEKIVVEYPESAGERPAKHLK
jgi:predicted acetyltransferase